MKIESIKLVYFSPTETTKSVVEGVARGYRATVVERINPTEHAV